jgi:hypothetical protein
MQQVFRIGITNYACRMTALSTRTIGAYNAVFKNAVIDQNWKTTDAPNPAQVYHADQTTTPTDDAQRTRTQALTLCQNRAYSRCSTACS